LRAILGLGNLPSHEERITAAFAEYISGRPQLSARQIHFLRAVREAVLRRDRLTTAALEQPPFSRIGNVRRLFSDQELNEILAFANALAA
jgi:type I restriction enzyme R subunit